jgi:hypothetical protein
MVIKEMAETLLVIAVLAVLAAATVFMMVELWQSASQMREGQRGEWASGLSPGGARRTRRNAQRFCADQGLPPVSETIDDPETLVLSWLASPRTWTCNVTSPAAKQRRTACP